MNLATLINKFAFGIAILIIIIFIGWKILEFYLDNEKKINKFFNRFKKHEKEKKD